MPPIPTSRSLTRTRDRARTLSAVALAALLAACGGGQPAAGGPPGGGMPPAEVGVVTVSPGDVGLQTELPGRLEASRTAQVRARAAGILLKREFTEGSDVKAGQRLFTIDPAPYQAALQTAQASQARAEANLAQARALAERYAPLVKENAISQQEYASAVAAQKTAEADVAAGKAAVQTATINLNYASVTAPIAGRIGR
ncbi:MAG: efflux RND transporter periplasmic adaptor subunit, partial [Hydrogenophaga sp.]|nr:efflux RND transporter periplasmic adaptor subunit [Hydrogenophaga sp.]